MIHPPAADDEFPLRGRVQPPSQLMKAQGCLDASKQAGLLVGAPCLATRVVFVAHSVSPFHMPSLLTPFPTQSEDLQLMYKTELKSLVPLHFNTQNGQ